MAKKYIDPEKIDFRVPYGMDASGEVLLPLSAVRAAIAQTPGEDVVEVVRCRVCKFRDPEDKRCEHHMNNNSFTRDDDDFCSYGKRKEQA